MAELAGHAGLRGGQDIGAGTAGHVVHEHGDGHGVVDSLEVLVDAFLRGLVVVGGDEQDGVSTHALSVLGEADGFDGIIGTRTGDDGNAALDLIHTDADGGFVFGMAHGGGFAGGAAGHEAVHTLFDLPFDMGAVGFFVDSTVLERRDQCGNGSVKHKILPREVRDSYNRAVVVTSTQACVKSCGTK